MQINKQDVKSSSWIGAVFREKKMRSIGEDMIKIYCVNERHFQRINLKCHLNTKLKYLELFL